MIAYRDLSNGAQQVLKLTMVYPHLTPNLKAVMTMDDSPSENDPFFKNGLTELEHAGLIDMNSSGVTNDRILTPLAYQILPKEVLLMTLEEARKALKKLSEENSFTQYGRSFY